MPSQLEVDFNEAMLDIYCRAKTEANYNAIPFLQMIADLGGTETAHVLINAPTVSEGYTELWARKRLDLTVESMVTRNPRFHELFTEEELDICRNRLHEYGQG